MVDGGRCDAPVRTGPDVAAIAVAAQGHAKHGERNRRLYRTVVVPQRANLAAAREDARRTARRSIV